jgi:NitT/TauT family transport system permease protein
MPATANTDSRFNWAGLAVLVLLVALWELYSRTLGARYGTIASAFETSQALGRLFFGGPLLAQSIHTLSISIAGWVIASLLGLAMGAAIGVWQPVWAYTTASIDVLRSIPSISLISIALVIFGFSSKMEMVVVIYVSQWPVLLATAAGVRAVPESYLDGARTLQLTRGATIRKILLPGALPNILVGLRLSLTLALALAVVAEMIGNPAGLGFGLVLAQQAMQPAEAFAYLVAIGVIGGGLNTIFVLTSGRLFRNHGPAL